MKKSILSLFVLATISMNVACKGEKENGEAGEVATATAESTTYVVDTKASSIDVFALQQSIDLNELNAENVDFYLIAKEEGLLSEAQTKALLTWLIAHPSHQVDAALMQQTRFKNEVLIYPYKDKLVQKDARIIPLWWAGAAALAAGIALLLTFGWNTNEGNSIQPNQPTIAQKNKAIQQNGQPKHPKQNLNRLLDVQLQSHY